MHTDLRFIFPVECDFFLIKLFSYGLVSGVYQGATVWFWVGGGGGLSWQIVFSISTARKFIFRYFDAKILTYFHPQQNLEKEKRVDGGGLDWMGGGGGG